MLGLVKDNKIIPLTTDAGTGAPIGTLIQQYKKVPMSGYLYCDGSTFDQNAYPALYMYLGTNVLPDYRECVMVGAEENTTDTIATHDVYGEGEFKDDQMQVITGSVVPWGYKAALRPTGAFGQDGTTEPSFATAESASGSRITFNSSNVTRTSSSTNVTHGKQKAVYVYIKATSGLAENQQDNVLRDVKDYIRKSNELSPVETITLTTDYQTAQYDGFLFVYIVGDTQTEILVNGATVYVSQVPSEYDNTAVIPLCKGDKFSTTITTSIIWCRARWYKNR